MVSTRVVFVGSAGIFGAAVHVRGVIIVLEEVGDALKLDAAEVVLAVRVVVVRELVEAANFLKQLREVPSESAATPSVMTTLPPVKVRRSKSLSSRIRTLLSLFDMAASVSFGWAILHIFAFVRRHVTCAAMRAVIVTRC